MAASAQGREIVSGRLLETDDVEDKESGEPQKIPLLRFYHVFNVAQCDGLKIGTEPVETPVNASSSRRKSWRTCRSGRQSNTA